MGGCAGTSQNSVCAYVQTNFITGPAETLASPLLRLRPKRTQPHGATPLCTRTCFPRTVTASSPSSRCAQHSVLVYSRTVHDSASSPSSRCTRHSVSVYSRTVHNVNVLVSYIVLVYSGTVHDFVCDACAVRHFVRHACICMYRHSSKRMPCIAMYCVV